MVWEEFLLFAGKDREANSTIRVFVDKVDGVVCDLNQQTFDRYSVNQLDDLWNSFLEFLRCDNRKLSAYWMSYIDMVENVLLALLRDSHEGNWNLHLTTIRSMIPWCFAYDKVVN